ncbi:hypothetical protein KC19_6G016100, partial [Ceratodon purpureus]
MSTVMEMVVTNPVERNIDDEDMNIHRYDIAKQRNHDSKLVEMLECFDVNWLQLERQKSANSINAILVGSAVVSTVTFTFLMQPRGGTAADQPPVPWLNQPEHVIGVFIILTSFSFTVSVLSLIVGINGLILNTETLKKEVQLLRKSVGWASQLLFMAIFFLVWAMCFGAMPTFHRVVPHRDSATQAFAGITMVGMPIFTTLVTMILLISFIKPPWLNSCWIIEQLGRFK